MKIELEVLDCDALVIAALQQSARTCIEVCSYTAEDKKYAKQYRKAVNVVLEHFGGEIVED